MGKYIVRVYLSSFYDVEVDARNADEAKEIAESCDYWDLVDPKDISLQDGETEILVDEGEEKVVTVYWDTDGEDTDLPTEVAVSSDIAEEDITDWLSDTYGFCVNSWTYKY